MHHLTSIPFHTLYPLYHAEGIVFVCSLIGDWMVSIWDSETLQVAVNVTKEQDEEKSCRILWGIACYVIYIMVPVCPLTLAGLSPHSPRPSSSASRTRSSGSSCCDASDCRFHPLPTPAPVAGRWTPWATIAPLARRLESCGPAPCRSSGLWREFAARRGARVATNVPLSRMNLDAPILDHRDPSKCWPTGSPSSMGRSWRSTRHWSVRSGRDGTARVPSSSNPRSSPHGSGAA